MTEEDLKQATEALAASKAEEHTVVPFNPAMEVEESLVSLLRNRITKIQEDEDFEQQIKDAIIARMPEASFSELMMLLGSIQGQSNTSVEKILSPFIPRVGERVPLLDTDKDKAQNTDEKTFDKASKKVLDSLNELSKLTRVLNSMENAEPANPDTAGEGK